MKRFILYLLVASLWASIANAASTLNIAWQDNSNNEDGFNIERSTSASGPFSKIATVGANITTYSNANLPEATNFCYRVNAFNASGASSFSNVICAVTKATLNMAKAGNGSGRVISVPAGINCTVSCAAQFSGNSTVALTATAAAGSFFTGWSGACTGTGSCTVTMNNQINVIANFSPNALAFAASGAGSGGALLSGGVETGGLARGPAFQLFNNSGVLQATQFALNPDFREVSFVLGNFDAGAAEEILVGGRETTGLMRGPAYQLFEGNGTLKLTRFVLNPNFIDVSFSPLNVGSNGVLVCGREASGLSRGPAYQAFDSNGNVVRTQFVLNPDFTADNSCMGTNLDGIVGDEVIAGGREVTGLARGPAIQVFGSSGSLTFTRFVLNPNFSETKFTVVEAGDNKNIVVYGRETSGAGRGPAYQMFDSSGNFILTRFVLNPDFTELQVFGANATNGVAGEEIMIAGLEAGGLARGPLFQVWDRNGNLLLTRFVLNPDFTEVKFTKIDINNDGVDEILVVGRETKGLARGPALQVWDGNGNLLLTQFVLNPDFTNLKVFAVDQNGDGDKEIGVGGIETSGLLRGPAYQIFESNGILIQTKFVLNQSF
jgi:Divergent InlB B-repeat domain